MRDEAKANIEKLREHTENVKRLNKEIHGQGEAERKVFIVSESDYDWHQIVAVYASRKDAEAHMRKATGSRLMDIEEYEVWDFDPGRFTTKGYLRREHVQ